MTCQFAAEPVIEVFRSRFHLQFFPRARDEGSAESEAATSGEVSDAAIPAAANTGAHSTVRASPSSARRISSGRSNSVRRVPDHGTYG